MGNFKIFGTIFMHPVSDMPLNCLENCIDAENLNNLTILLLVITCTNVSRFRFNQKIIPFYSSNKDIEF
jgi:hypothetical protein